VILVGCFTLAHGVRFFKITGAAVLRDF